VRSADFDEDRHKFGGVNPEQAFDPGKWRACAEFIKTIYADLRRPHNCSIVASNFSILISIGFEVQISLLMSKDQALFATRNRAIFIEVPGSSPNA
jgi:hypothetical protein